MPAYVQAGDLPWFEWPRHRAQWCGLVHRLMGPMDMVMLLELAQGPAQVALVQDQRPLQKFMATGLHPALHDGVLRGIRTPVSKTWMPESAGT